MLRAVEAADQEIGVPGGYPMKIATTKPEIVRCPWATTPLGIVYHDEEWGRPVHDDRRLFEFLVLEGAQAGLSWETILRRRQSIAWRLRGLIPSWWPPLTAPRSRDLWLTRGSSATGSKSNRR